MMMQHLLVVEKADLAAGGRGEHGLSNAPDQAEEAWRIYNKVPAAHHTLHSYPFLGSLTGFYA